MESPVKTTAPKMSKAPVEKIISIDVCRDCKKHRGTTWHDETKYEANYNQVKAAIEALIPGVTVEKKLDEIVNVGAFEILHKEKVLFSKKVSGLWPNAKAVAQRVQSYFEDLEKGNDTSHYGKQKEKAYVPKKLSEGGRTFSGVTEFHMFSPKASQNKAMSQTSSGQKEPPKGEDTIKEDKPVEPAQEEKKEPVVEKKEPVVEQKQQPEEAPNVQQVAAPKKSETTRQSITQEPTQQSEEPQQVTEPQEQAQEQPNAADQEAEKAEVLKKQQEEQEAEKIKQEQLKEAQQKEDEQKEKERKEAEKAEADRIAAVALQNEKEQQEKAAKEQKEKEEAEAAAALAQKEQEQKTENKPAEEQSPAPKQETKEAKAADEDEYNEEKFEETEDKPAVEKKKTDEEEYSQDFNN